MPIYTCSSATVWTTWVDNQTATNTQGVWLYWNATSASMASIVTTGNPNYEAQLHAERAALCAQNAAADARRVREAQQRRVEVNNRAEARAEALLLAHLTPEQAASYKQHRFFEVLTTCNGQLRRYRISYGWAGNIILLDDKGLPASKYCIHPTKAVPYADNLLAQKLLLETDEARFLQIANRTRLTA